MLNNIGVNYFDFIVVVWLILGLSMGRKHGMSQELLPMLKWLAIIFACGLLYKPFADVIVRNTAKSFDILWATAQRVLSFIIAFVDVPAAFFNSSKNAVGEKTGGQRHFLGTGREYLSLE